MAISSFVFMGGCLSKYTSVNFDYTTEAQIETAAVTSVGTQTFGETVMNSELKAELEKNNTSLDLLDELKLKSATVTITNDSNARFDNVEMIELWLSADGMPEVMIASKNPVPDGLNTINLNVNSSENLANYIKANSFTYRVKGTNSGPLSPMTLKANVIWEIKASAK
ncbi:MAG: hypothetical protein JNM67_07995 [Bacteroidetes bacterium]|nr:hypothetical protein [Bacteroidota bacterium]